MIHDFLVAELWPADQPVSPREFRDKGLLDSAVSRPFQTAFGEQLHKTIFEKAAALFHSLIANHPFANGNKRTAVMALDHFLLANGFFLLLPEGMMYDLAKRTASYRGEGRSHEDMFAEIVGLLHRAAISLRKHKRMTPAHIYRQILEARHSIRKHPLNAPSAGRD
jgi:death-on-curing family protein